MGAKAVQTRRAGFTLLELVVVLTLLSVLAAIAAPRLTGFLAGRNLQEEARRLLSLTRYARAEAINRGQRVTVWFEPKTSTYGARTDPADPQDNPLDVEFTCPSNLTLEIDAAALDKEGQATILCWPDGTIDPDSVDRVELWEDGKPSFALVRQETGMEYSLEEVTDVQTR